MKADDMRLADKVAIVTGAARGNGRAIAVRFAEEGADIVVSDLNEAGMEETARLVRQQERRALTVRCDVRHRDDVQAAVDAAVAEFGRVDIMVANAGISVPDAFLELSDDDWDAVLDVNLKGVFLSDQIAARQMVKQGSGGAIVNIASIMAEMGSAAGSNYAASKAGVKSLTKSAALALTPYNIRVNAIGPGFIETDMTQFLNAEPAIGDALLMQTPMNRVGEPIDVANAAVFLASDESKFMTGQTIFPDGGFLLNYVKPSDDVIAASRRLSRLRGLDGAEGTQE